MMSAADAIENSIHRWIKSVDKGTVHIYEVRPRKDKRGVDLISDALPFGRLWYGEPDAVSNAIGYASHYSRSQGAVIQVYDEAGNGERFGFTREHDVGLLLRELVR
jgi:hypothetical protein